MVTRTETKYAVECGEREHITLSFWCFVLGPWGVSENDAAMSAQCNGWTWLDGRWLCPAHLMAEVERERKEALEREVKDGTNVEL